MSHRPATLRSRLGPCLFASLALVVLTLVPVDLQAQTLRYESVSQMQFGGSMGDIMGILSVGDEPTIDTVWIGEGKMRTDSEGATSIMDFREGSLIQIDHEAETWFSYDFGDIAEMQERMQAQVADQMDEAERQQQEAQREMSDQEMPEFTGSFSLDRTGRSSNLNGFDAEQVFMTMEMEAQSEEEQGANPAASLRMVYFTEMWMSDELEDHPAFQQMAEGAMEFAREDLEMDMGALSTAVASDPRMIEAMERYAEEMQGMSGMAVRTTSLFLVLPPEIEFDRQKAIEKLEMAPPRELSFDFSDAAADAAREGALSAARGALSRFGLSRGGDDEEEDDEGELEAPSQQMTIMRMLQELRGVEEVASDPGLWTPPADYREIASPLSEAGVPPGR